MTSSIEDTIDDFYNSPYPIGSYYKYIFGKFETSLGSRYEGYNSDIQSAYAKLGNGTYSFFESKANLMYIMRSQFTNE